MHHLKLEDISVWVIGVCELDVSFEIPEGNWGKHLVSLGVVKFGFVGFVQLHGKMHVTQTDPYPIKNPCVRYLQPFSVSLP